MDWQRADGTDGSPLQVDGKALEESMFTRSPGDMSPKETKVETVMKKGDKAILRLEGDFGGGTPLLSFTFSAD